ncbi:H-type lectin domain-containing protein [Streptomyces sp. NPDC012617]|uniref:H-type lectin domain-containing protein n=1 Tax=Streptomyces TaxID=1883 RepID=UPI0033CC89E1
MTPFTVGVSCDDVAECVGDHLDAPLTYDAATGQMGLELSQDAGNLLSVRPDGGLFVPTAGASAGLIAGQAIAITGSQGAGYTIAARISADAGNSLRLGTDGGLFVHVPPALQNVETFSFTNVTSFTRNITFTTPFAAPPHVTVNINSGAGPTARWGARAINVSTTGFTIFLFSGALGETGTWASVPVSWRATGL